MPIYIPRKTRAELQLTGRGIVTESLPQIGAVSTQLLVTQTVYFALVGVRKGDVLTNVVVDVAVAGSSLTLVKGAVYAADGTQLAVTADSKASFSSTGIKTMALSSPYTMPADGIVYLAILAVGTTPPTLLRGASQIGSTDPVGSGSRPAGAQTGQSDIPTTATVGTSSIGLWLAAS
jgi:hypothetical protein